jgi:D-alanyl-D-alanine-carboxypeptidase/D-alanyl-D-alanine-endopeptidase
VLRSTVRELVQGSNFPRVRDRRRDDDAPACRQPIVYGMGVIVGVDCDLGVTINHGGGYPGYGSHVLLRQDRGVGLFVYTNRTYSGPSVALWKAAVELDKAGLLGKERELPISTDLAEAYRTMGAMYAAGDVAIAQGQLAMNFLLDRDADAWSRELKKLKASAARAPLWSLPERSPAISRGAALMAGSRDHCCLRQRIRHASRNGNLNRSSREGDS